MQLVEVNDAKTAREFILVNVEVNRRNPNYIRPLNKDIEDVFLPGKNKNFRLGECKRWILVGDDHKLLGRIAAFTNRKYRNKGDAMKVGGIGFFDCINDQDAADMLFDVSRHWLAQHGIQAMDGPINFGERDRWWGLVTEGFQEPLYCMNFNLPYYKSLFEKYGFKTFYNQICFGLDPKKKVSDKILKRHEHIAADPDFAARHMRKNNLEKCIQDFTIVYNKAWAGHGGLKEMRKEQVKLLFNKMKPIIDERIIWFTYYKEEPIAMFINLPDLNQWFKYLHGKFDLLHKLKFLWLQRTKTCKKFTGLVFGVVPEFQGKGVDAYMIQEAARVIQQDDVPYTEYEMQWIGDFNPKMLNIAKGLGEVYTSRKLVTYRYLFDPTMEFKRHPVLS